MMYETTIVLIIYATYVLILIHFYNKRVDKLEDRIVDIEEDLKELKNRTIDIEEDLRALKGSLYITDSK